MDGVTAAEGAGELSVPAAQERGDAARNRLRLLDAARTLIAKGDLKQAALTLNKAQKQLPNDPRVFMLAGLMAEKSGNINGAFEALRRSVAMAPDWGPGLLELALLPNDRAVLHERIERRFDLLCDRGPRSVVAARRALAEAAARRKAEAAAEAAAASGEKGGPKGPEPTRYGDWERKGIAVDF